MNYIELEMNGFTLEATFKIYSIKDEGKLEMTLIDTLTYTQEELAIDGGFEEVKKQIKEAYNATFEILECVA